MNRRAGLFIAFEGGEAVGKSTQISILRNRLAKAGVDAVFTREPGGSHIGSTLRRELLDPAGPAIDPKTEALLFAADRAEHVATVIRPALDEGNIIVSDRYIDSSIAYQGAARKLGIDTIRDISLWATDGLVPDMTFLLDAEPTQVAKRLATSEFGSADRIEKEDLAFATTLRDTFRHLAAENEDRYRVIDATDPVDVVAAEVWEVVQLLLAD